MMGWVSSPPTFCAASETVADLANATLYKCTVPPHHLEDTASIHNCWEPFPQTLYQEEPSSPAVRGPLATKTHRWGESSYLAVHDPLAMRIHRWGESSPLAMRGPLAMDIHHCEASLPQLVDCLPLLTLPEPVAHVNVFIDNFIGLAQGSQRRCQNIRQCIMHAIDAVFAQRDAATMH